MLNHPTQTFFNQLFIFMNLYQHAKNKAVSSVCAGDIADLKIHWLVESIWANISGTRLSEIWDLHKISTKKILLFAHFPTFGGTKNFFQKKKKKNSALSRNTSCGFLTLCQNLKKTNDQVPRKPRADISLDLSGYSWGYSLESHIFQPFV